MIKRLFSGVAMAIAFTMLSVSAKAQTAAADTAKKITIKVTNLHCGNDMPTIKKRLLNTDGIDEVTFTDIAGETSVFTITYHTSVTSQQQIERLVESTPGCDNKDETPYRVKRSNPKKQAK